MSLREIFCQDKAISILQRALAAGRMPHAYVFAGVEGVGKFKTAREWARLLLCGNVSKQSSVTADFADSCGLCQSCLLFEAGSHPDFNHIYKELREFTRDGKGKKTPVDLPIDVIRQFLIDKVSTRPTMSAMKVFIVSEAEKLNAASQNCLLKVLEEPPEYCCIILLCTRLKGLLPTTRSRCQIIRFAPIAEVRIIEQLKKAGLEQKKAEYFARLAEGSLGWACQWGRLELADANLYQAKGQLLDAISKYRYPDALDLAQRFLAQSQRLASIWAKLDASTSGTDINRRAAKTLVRVVISALRDAMKSNVTGTERIVNFDQAEQIKSLASRFGAETAGEKIIEACRSMLWIDSSVNEKLIFDQLLLNLAVSDTISF